MKRYTLSHNQPSALRARTRSWSPPAVAIIAALMLSAIAFTQEPVLSDRTAKPAPGDNANAAAPFLLPTVLTSGSTGPLPREPLDIGTTTQFFIDDYLIDNRYPLDRVDKENVVRVVHVPVKYEGNPVLGRNAESPRVIASLPNVKYDKEAKLFRMWYQGNVIKGDGQKRAAQGVFGFDHIRYAESKDGVHWTIPKLGIYEHGGNRDNNICLAHEKCRPALETQGTQGGITGVTLLNEQQLPEQDRRGYKYLMTYTLRAGQNSKNYLIGTKDGVHWDRMNAMPIMAYDGDGWFGVLYDPQQRKYVAYCRPRDRYQTAAARSRSHKHESFDDAGDLVYQGRTRRIGFIENGELWTDKWERAPQILFLPDGIDLANGVTSHMAMRGKCFHEGVFFGFLQPYIPKTAIWTELVLSRDRRTYQRCYQPRILDTGPEGAWDSRQAWFGGEWIEVGDEWWIYYMGCDAAPNTDILPNHRWGIGLAKIRKEGFVSMRTPGVGGVIVTKLLKWPGGELLVNCDVPQGEMRVRVTDRNRQEVEGMGYRDCIPFAGSSVAHKIRWNERSLDELKGRDVRLEFYFKAAGDLYAFRATGAEN